MFRGIPWWKLPNKREIAKQIADKRRGRPLTEEHCRHISEGKKGKPAWNSGLRTKWLLKKCPFCGKMFGSWVSADKKYCSLSCAIKHRGKFNFQKGMPQINPRWREALEKAWKNNPFLFKKGKHFSPETEFKKGHKSTLGRKRPLDERLAIGRDRRAFFRQHPEKHPNRILIKTNFISKAQRELHKILMKVFPDATLNYPIITEGGAKFADIGIPSLKLDVEYDGQYWHKKRKKQDKRRDLDLHKVGWTTIRVEEIGNVLEEIPCCVLAHCP